jgi:hypothetical protein
MLPGTSTMQQKNCQAIECVRCNESEMNSKLETTSHSVATNTTYVSESKNSLLCFPADVFLVILDNLDMVDLKHVQESCKSLWEICASNNVWRRRELLCFHSKFTFEEETLGVGLQLERHRDGVLKGVSSTFDLVSQSAWKAGVRHSVWRDEMTHWLPVILNASHAERALPKLKESILAIWREGIAMDHRRVHKAPHHGSLQEYVSAVLDVLPKLMNRLVVELMSDTQASNVVSRHCSDRALEGYCYVHHMLLKLTEQCPAIAHEAERRVSAFLRNEQSRSKGNVPDLGAWLCLLTLSNTNWHQCATRYIRESFDRHVRWMIRECPEILRSSTLPFAHWDQRAVQSVGLCGKLASVQKTKATQDGGKAHVKAGKTNTARNMFAALADINTEVKAGADSVMKNTTVPIAAVSPMDIEDRLWVTLKLSRTSLRLLMFQVEFLKLIGRPSGLSCQDVLRRYDQGLGTQGPRLRAHLQSECQKILGVQRWTLFFNHPREL